MFDQLQNIPVLSYTIHVSENENYVQTTQSIMAGDV